MSTPPSQKPKWRQRLGRWLAGEKEIEEDWRKRLFTNFYYSKQAAEMQKYIGEATEYIYGTMNPVQQRFIELVILVQISLRYMETRDNDIRAKTIQLWNKYVGFYQLFLKAYENQRKRYLYGINTSIIPLQQQEENLQDILDRRYVPRGMSIVDRIWGKEHHQAEVFVGMQIAPTFDPKTGRVGYGPTLREEEEKPNV